MSGRFIELDKSIDKVNTLLADHSWLKDMVESAEENPARTVISAISNHQPSVDAAEIARAVGIDVTLVGPETGTKAEKNHYATRLAQTLEERRVNKIGRIYAQLEQLPEERFRDQRTQEKVEKLQAQLAELEAELKDSNFLAEAKSNLFGDFASVWLSVLRAYEGEYQAVVGGGDCPTAEFIRALLQGTSQPLGRAGGGYIFAGNITGDMAVGPIGLGDDEKLSNQIVAVTDAALDPEPNSEQQAAIAFSMAKVLESLFPEIAAKIAVLSYSTGPSGGGKPVDRDRAVYDVLRKNYPNSLPAYGPMQLDAAISERTAICKLPSFERGVKKGTISQEELDVYQLVAGMATVITAQSLEVGNPLSKAIRGYWSGSVEIGPLILPIDIFELFVASDLSRGEDAVGIFFTLVALSVLAQSNQVK